MDSLLSYMPEWALPYVYKLTFQQWLLVGYAACALLVLGGFSLAVYCFARALGYVWYQGRFHSPERWQAIVQELYSGVREGRVPDYETMKILDRYIYGRSGSSLRNLNKADHI